MCSEFCVCATCSGNLCGHSLTDAMLPPVDTRTVLLSLILKGSLWLCVHGSRGLFDSLFCRTDLAGNGLDSVPTVARGFPSRPSIYLRVSGKVALTKLFAFCTFEICVYSVCCKACGINSLNLEVSTAACSGVL